MSFFSFSKKSAFWKKNRLLICLFRLAWRQWPALWRGQIGQEEKRYDKWSVKSYEQCHWVNMLAAGQRGAPPRRETKEQKRDGRKEEKPMYSLLNATSGSSTRWSCGAMDNASAYGAEDSRFESWQDRYFLDFPDLLASILSIFDCSFTFS